VAKSRPPGAQFELFCISDRDISNLRQLPRTSDTVVPDLPGTTRMLGGTNKSQDYL